MVVPGRSGVAAAPMTSSASAGGTKPVRIPCHLTSFAGSQPCASSGASHAALSPRHSSARTATPPRAKSPSVPMAALVEEEEAHENNSLGFRAGTKQFWSLPAPLHAR